MFFHIIPKSRTIWCLCKYVFPVCVLVLCVTLPSVPVLVPSGVVVLVGEVGFRACRYLSCLHRHGPLVENPRGLLQSSPCEESRFVFLASGVVVLRRVSYPRALESWGQSRRVVQQ